MRRYNFAVLGCACHSEQNHSTAIHRFVRSVGKLEGGGGHAMWDAKNKTVSGCYENAFIARQNKSIKTDELPAEHSDTKTETTSMLHSAGIFVKTLVQWNQSMFVCRASFRNFEGRVPKSISGSRWHQDRSGAQHLLL